MHRVGIRHWVALAIVLTACGGGIAACSDDPEPDAFVQKEAGGGETSTSDAGDAGEGGSALDCEIAIVGGGPGGVHTAYKLTNPGDAGTPTGLTSGGGVCLFEKNDRLGGRIRDVSFGPNPGDVTGTGAYRMYDNQYTFQLANELGVTVEAPFDFSNLRGLQDPGGNPGQYFGYSGDAFKALYGQTMNDDDMWGQLLCGNQVPKDDAGVPNYNAIEGGIATKSTVAYANDVLGANGAKYFFDQNRFRADFTADVDAIGYLEYSVIDYYGSGAIRYPTPGHSAILEKMRAATVAKGGRVFLSDAVKSINSQADGSFSLVTDGHTVSAKQVILAIPLGAIAKVTGDVITTITAAKEYKNVTAAKSMQVTHQWDKQWWHSDLRYPDAGAVVGGDLPDGAAPILRADTTIMPDGYCINSIEMPYTAQRDALKVTRTVYSDNRTCVDKNLTLYGNGGTAGEQALDAELLKSLRILFPGIFDGSANEPKITKTDVNVHEEAWFYLKTGATANGVTNKSILDWSATPIADKKLYLVGDTWYPLGSGWSNAAYVSSIRVLNTHFGLNMPPHELPKTPCP
jgi:hypothetical protein